MPRGPPCGSPQQLPSAALRSLPRVTPQPPRAGSQAPPPPQLLVETFLRSRTLQRDWLFDLSERDLEGAHSRDFFSHSRGVAGSLTLRCRLLAPPPTSWALSSRWSALLLTRCPSALTPSQIATVLGSSSLRLLLHCSLRFSSITDLCPQVLAPEYFPNPASVEGEGWHRRVARDTGGNERLSLSGS